METRDPARVAANFPLRYGADDELGAANEITPDRVVKAAALVRTGARYNLAQVVSLESPAQTWRHWRTKLNYEHTMPGHFNGPNQLSFVEENVEGSFHSGTHLDGLGHAGIGEQAYNGYRYSDIVTSHGLTRLGIQAVPPFVTRGVLLDITAVHGKPLDDDQMIGADDLQEAASSQSVDVLPGDALILHTGWSRHWEEDPERYITTEPGLGVDAASWCTDRRVCLIGADNWAVEVVPPFGDALFPVHQHCIARFGCYLLENVRTEELIRDGVTEFCFVLLPIRSKGASGSPVAPVAVT